VRRVKSEFVLNGARILVVEDDSFICMELGAILTAAGAEVVGPCRTLAEARGVVVADGISGAVLDFRLGRQTSLPVARQLRERGIPFLFFTGQINTNELLAEYPSAKVVFKPFQRRTILAAVSEMLERERHPRARA
jgi:DNA-binding response OmpR family regulator